MKTEKNKPAKTHKSEVLNEFFSVSDKSEYEKTEKRMLLAVRIENSMKEKGFNKIQFASAMKVQPSVITKWLSGTHNFTTDTLFDIEQVLGVSLVNQNEPSHMQTINRIYFTVSVTNSGPAHPFFSGCSPQKSVVKVTGQKMILQN